MALTLSQAALQSQDELQRGVVETFVQESVVLDRLPLLTVNGNAYAYNEEQTLPGVEFRAVNSGYAESTGTINQRTESLVILGGDADVDRFLVQTRGNLADLRAEQTRMKVKAATYKFQDAFINGDVAVDANSFDGLKKRLTGGQVIDAGGAPIIGVSDDARHTFFDLLDSAIAAVPGATPGNTAIYSNASLLGRIRSAARRLTIYDQTTDTFGRTIGAYNGFPLLDIGNKADGTPVIPVTAGTSDIYVVKFGNDEGDRAVTGLSNGGIQTRDLGELQEKPVFRTRIEFYCGLAVFGGAGASRLINVGNA